MADPIRVLVADDHPVYRDGLRALLASSDAVELVAEAVDGNEAVRLALELEPAVVLMDLAMPERNGIDATRAIAAARPGIAVLVLTMFEDDDSVFSAMRAGARGYLLKDADGEQLLRAVAAIAHGDAIFGAGVARRVQSYFAAAGARRVEPFPDLTEREREVLDRIARGEDNGRIADRLGISPKTVRNHVSTILDKLMVADRSQAIVRAREAGLGTDVARRQATAASAAERIGPEG
jgi:DNA-binding NarL/FixJ family response regulator